MILTMNIEVMEEHPSAIPNVASADPLDPYVERVGDLRAAVDLIPPDAKERLRLRRSLGLSRAELASVVGCAPGTLKRFETDTDYMPRGVAGHVLNGLALFYRAAGYVPVDD